MPLYVAFIIGGILAVAGTVLAMIFITPEKRRGTLPGFLRVVADIFNFKFLILEYILKALYILETLACILIGFFMLFSGVRFFGGGFYSFALYGVMLMILGPIVVRLLYEGIMLFILLVKNTMEINKKLGGSGVGSGSFTSPEELKNDYISKKPKAPKPPKPPKQPKQPQYQQPPQGYYPPQPPQGQPYYPPQAPQYPPQAPQYPPQAPQQPPQQPQYPPQAPQAPQQPPQQ